MIAALSKTAETSADSMSVRVESRGEVESRVGRSGRSVRRSKIGDEVTYRLFVCDNYRLILSRNQVARNKARAFRVSEMTNNPQV